MTNETRGVLVMILALLLLLLQIKKWDKGSVWSGLINLESMIAILCLLLLGILAFLGKIALP
jgi:hypothetical protein